MAVLEIFTRSQSPIPDTPEKLLFLNENLRDIRTASFVHYGRSQFPSLLGQLQKDLGGNIVAGEAFGDLLEELNWPIYDESVISGFFWEKDDLTSGKRVMFALGIETTPTGTIFVHGGGMSMDKNFPFGSSVLLPSEWRGNREIQKKALDKAVMSPKILDQEKLAKLAVI